MTLAEVRKTAEELTALGNFVSANTVLARRGSGSKRDAVKFLRALRAEQQASPPVPPSPDVAPAVTPGLGMRRAGLLRRVGRGRYVVV